MNFSINSLLTCLEVNNSPTKKIVNALCKLDMFTNAHNVYFNKEFLNFIIENSNKTYTSTTNDINKDESADSMQPRAERKNKTEANNYIVVILKKEEVQTWSDVEIHLWREYRRDWNTNK